MNKLYILVGNIGSGKSTFAQNFIEEKRKKGKKIIYVSRDSLRYMFGAGKYNFDPELEPLVIQGTLDLLNGFMRTGIDIVLDETNISVDLRKDFIDLGKKYQYYNIALIMPRLLKKTSVDRRMKIPHDIRDRKIWERVWDKFNEQYDTPTIKEGFNEIRFLEKDNEHLLRFKKL